MQKIEIAFSPCPNDTFIFDALVNGKIDTGDFRFMPVLEDVQTLNLWALQHKYPITKISYGVLPKILDDYMVCNAGSALGNGVGPLLIQNENENYFSENIKDTLVAIPGEDTTAHLLFKLAFPNVENKIFLRYDAIEKFVKEENGVGVIIHENRFTYHERGFKKIIDLGNFWEEQTNNPIPLGGIVASKRLDEKSQYSIDKLIKASIKYAYAQLPHLSNFITENAQEMTTDVMKKHIDLYVNEYSLSLGEYGRSAILKLLDVAHPNQNFGDEIFVKEFD